MWLCASFPQEDLMNLLRCTAIALVGLLVIPLARVDAGSEKVAFPANFKSGVLYNVIDRDDQKEVHQQYTSREAIEAAKAGKPLPGASLIAHFAMSGLRASRQTEA
jgi:hypothetical protein